MRSDCPRNLILIGMPGAGKSTIGVLLAKRLGYHFIDTDLFIQVRARARLQQIIAARGMPAFKELEERTLCELTVNRSVIATGGSAVYSEPGMHHLAQLGCILFLDIPLQELQRRVDDMDTRGLVLDPGEDFAQLFARRRPLYQAWAQITINGAGMKPDAIAAAIESRACGGTVPAQDVLR